MKTFVIRIDQSGEGSAGSAEEIEMSHAGVGARTERSLSSWIRKPRSRVFVMVAVVAGTAGASAASAFIPDAGFARSASAAMAGASSSAPVWSAGTEVPLSGLTNAPGANPKVELDSVSCWAAGDCAAVGTYQSGSTTPALLLTELNHVWQPPAEGIGPDGPIVALPSVSCVAGASCVAVGDDVSGGQRHPFEFTMAGGAWQPIGTALQLPSDRYPGDPQPQMRAVSCWSAGNCVAVGTYLSTAGSFPGYGTSSALYVEQSGSWLQGTPVVPPNDTIQPQATVLSDVSCSSAGQCAEVGSYTNTAGHGVGMSLYNQTNAAALQPPANLSAGGSSEATGVSCAAGGYCGVSGTYDTSSGGAGFLLEGTAGTWSQAVEATAPPSGSPAAVSAVSCGATSVCAAIGQTPASGSGRGIAWDAPNGTWATPGTMLTPPSGDVGVQVYGLSCAAAGECGAFGWNDNLTPAAVTESGGGWQQAQDLSLPGNGSALQIPADPISCGAPGDCAAVAYYNDDAGNQQGVVWTSTAAGGGTTPTSTTPTSTKPTSTTPTSTTPVVTQPHPTIGGAHVAGLSVLVPVSCSGPGACAVVLQLSITERLNGHRVVGVTAAVKHRHLMVGRATATVASGSNGTVKVTLTAAGRRLLSQRHVLPTRLTLTEGGKVYGQARVTFKTKHR